MRYDVVVVGAGASGAALAARLSEDPRRSVLLVEAGPAPATRDGFPTDLLDATLLSGAMPDHPHNWAYPATLTSQVRATVARGRILGGSTTLNGTYFIRGRRRDFDAYAASGNPAWSFAEVLPYFRRLETDLTYGSTPWHGGSGPVPVDRTSAAGSTAFTRAFVAACRELGHPWEADKNGQQPPGVGPLPRNAVDGERRNTGLTYILPARDRPNLTVSGDTTVRRVLLTGTTATGVEVERGGRIEVVEADEVVLAAGAFGSPHLLALSGIGPAGALRRAGLPVVVDLPGVGRNLSDHPQVRLDIAVRISPRATPRATTGTEILQCVLHLASSGSGTTGDCGDDADLEILPFLRPLAVVMGTADAVPDGDLTLFLTLLRPRARGTVTTVSPDLEVRPRVDYHYLDDADDRRRLRELVREAVRLTQTAAFAPVVRQLASPDPVTLADDTRLDAWILDHLATAIHACGTCRMGPDPAAGDVVDQRGRVHGVTGLRVADTSILPFAPSRGPAATAVMIGERMADLMSAPSIRPS